MKSADVTQGILEEYVSIFYYTAGRSIIRVAKGRVTIPMLLSIY